MSKTYVLYHASCMDGKMAAFVAMEHFKQHNIEATYIPVQYNTPFPEIELDKETEIYILDFSYDRVTLVGIHQKVKKLVVLDHHKTAEAALRWLPFAHFDMEKSGATLAWEYFHPGKEAPDLVKYVEDRDLWRFKLPGTRSLFESLVTRGALSGELDEKGNVFSKYIEENYVDGGFDDLIREGEILEKYRDNQIKALGNPSSKKVLITTFQDKTVGVFNTTHFISESGSVVYSNLDVDFSMSYFLLPEGNWVFNLRSKAGGVDVSAICKLYGGGGHHNAAGFSLPFDKGSELLKQLINSGKVGDSHVHTEA